jgi:type IV secretory pathway VirB4 component
MFINFRRKGGSVKQIDILSIEDGIMKLRGGKYVTILQTSSINFELKSDQERDVIIDGFESFLNSIGFAIQILIRTREIDIDEYLDGIDRKILREKHPLYKLQLKNYKIFVRKLVKDNKILSRQFYVSIAFNTETNTDPNLIKEQLSLRSGIVSKNLGRIGISCKELDSIAVIGLFYNFYNPNLAKIQPITNDLYSHINEKLILAV